MVSFLRADSWDIFVRYPRSHTFCFSLSLVYCQGRKGREGGGGLTEVTGEPRRAVGLK